MYQLFSRVRDGLKELATAFASYIKVSVGTYIFNTGPKGHLKYYHFTFFLIAGPKDHFNICHCPFFFTSPKGHLKYLSQPFFITGPKGHLKHCQTLFKKCCHLRTTGPFKCNLGWNGSYKILCSGARKMHSAY